MRVIVVADVALVNVDKIEAASSLCKKYPNPIFLGGSKMQFRMGLSAEQSFHDLEP